MNKQEFEAWVMSEEGRAVAAPFIDKRVTQALSTYSKNHPASVDLGPILDAVEKRLEDKDMELEKEKQSHFTYRKCVEAGIDPELMYGFEALGEKEIVEKIEQLKRMKVDNARQVTNELMSTLSAKPGSGDAKESINLSKLSLADAVQLEERKKLDKLM